MNQDARSYDFLRLILDSITEHLVVIDENGNIQFVNRSWLEFAGSNASAAGEDWRGVNYLEECEKASSMGDQYGEKAGNGIRSVIEGRESIFYLEYPCHSPEEKRWFMMRVTPFQIKSVSYLVISHQNITERVMAEEEVRKLARIDGLTGIANRRAFDEFLHREWNRCRRLKKQISLAIVDIDHFKILNDSYGHPAGDECLVKIGALLKEYARRPGDLCARYGGEEFALVWGDSSIEEAEKMALQFSKALADLKIPNSGSPTGKYVSASIGLSGMVPDADSEEKELIARADRMLYRAKKNGRNRIES